MVASLTGSNETQERRVVPDHPPKRFTPWEPMDPGKLPPFCSVPPGPVGLASLTAPSVEKGPLGIQGGATPGWKTSVQNRVYTTRRACVCVCFRACAFDRHAMQPEGTVEHPWRNVCHISVPSVRDREDEGKWDGRVYCAAMHPFLPRMVVGCGREITEMDLSNLNKGRKVRLEHNVVQIAYTDKPEISVAILEDASVWKVDTRLQCAVLVFNSWKRTPSSRYHLSTIENVLYFASDGQKSLQNAEMWPSDVKIAPKGKARVEMSQPITAMFMSSRKRVLFLGHANGKAKGYDIASLKKLRTMTIPTREKNTQNQPITCIYQGSTDLVTIGNSDGSIAVWSWPQESTSGTRVIAFINNPNLGTVHSAIFLNEHASVIAHTGEENQIHIWKAEYRNDGTATLIPADTGALTSAVLGSATQRNCQFSIMIAPCAEACLSFILDTGTGLSDKQCRSFLDVSVVLPVSAIPTHKDFVSQTKFILNQADGFEGNDDGVLFLDGNDVCRGSMLQNNLEVICTIPAGYRPISLSSSEALDDVQVACNKQGAGAVVLQISKGKDSAVMPGRASAFIAPSDKRNAVLSQDGMSLILFNKGETWQEQENGRMTLPFECLSIFPGPSTKHLLLVSATKILCVDMSIHANPTEEACPAVRVEKRERVVQVQWQELKGYGTYGAILTDSRVFMVTEKMQVITSVGSKDASFTSITFGHPRLISILWVGPALLVSTQNAIVQLTWNGGVRFVGTLSRGNKQKSLSTLIASSTDRVFTLCTWVHGQRTIATRYVPLFQTLVWGWLSFKQSDLGSKVNLASEIPTLLSQYDSTKCTVDLMEALDKADFPDLSLLLAKVNTNIPLTLALKYAVHAKKFSTAYHIIYEQYEKSLAFPRIVKYSDIYEDFVSLGETALTYGQFKVARNCFRLASVTESELTIDICSGDFESARDAIEAAEEDESFDLGMIVADAAKFLLTDKKVTDWEMRVADKIEWTAKGLFKAVEAELLQDSQNRIKPLEAGFPPYYYEVSLEDAPKVEERILEYQRSHRKEGEGFVEDTLSWAGAKIGLPVDLDEEDDLMGGAIVDGEESKEEQETLEVPKRTRAQAENETDKQRLDVDLAESSDDDESDILADLGLAGHGNSTATMAQKKVDETNATSLYKAGVDLLEDGNMEEAANFFAKSIKLLTAAEHVAGKGGKIIQCLHYRVAARLMAAVKENDLDGDSQESARLLRYASMLKLEPKHRTRCILDAALRNLEVGNNRFAKDKAEYLLSKSVANRKGKLASQLQGIIQHSNETGVYDACIPVDENLFDFLSFSLEATPAELEDRVTQVLTSF